MPDAAAVLGPQRLARVKSIFTTWDMDGTGKIEISAFKGTTVKAGPVESKVLDQLSVMDYNDDGYVVAEVRRVGTACGVPPSQPRFSPSPARTAVAGDAGMGAVLCVDVRVAERR